MFNVSIRNRVLSDIVTDTCVSLAKNGIKKIILLNGHHGNLGSLQYTSQEVRSAVASKVHVYTLHYWHALDREFDHAGLVETSLVLAIAPELVKMNRAAPNSKRLAKSKQAYGAITNEPGSFPRITGNGVWGDPRKSSAKQGNELLEQVSSRLTKTISQLEP
jgi:creatinine amidohydrolase